MPPVQEGGRHLRVCADPNYLPFSNHRFEGFENNIGEAIAQDLRADLHYTWLAQGCGFVRNRLKAGLCDLLIETSPSARAIEAVASGNIDLAVAWGL